MQKFFFLDEKITAVISTAVATQKYLVYRKIWDCLANAMGKFNKRNIIICAP